MEDLNKQSNDWIQNNNSEKPEGQAPNEAEKLAESYRSLESEYTKSRQNFIEMAVIAASSSPESILKIPDKKVQDAVVKRIYGYESLAQLQSIEWNDFYKDKSGDDISEIEKLSKEVKILRHTSESKELDNAIERYKMDNKDLFNASNAEELIRNELKYISTELPHAERVKRAAFNALGSQYDPTSLAYKAIATASAIRDSANNNNSDTSKTKTQIEQKQDELRAFFGINKTK